MFYGLWKFSLLNYQSILRPSTIPRKKRTEEKGGGGSLIHQGIRMKAWPPEFLGNGRVCSPPKAREWLPFPGGLEALKLEAKRMLGKGSWGLLWAPAPMTRSSSAGWWSWRAGKQARWLQISTVSVCLVQTKKTEQPGSFYQPNWTAKQPKRKKQIAAQVFSLNNHSKQFQKLLFLRSPLELGWGCRGSAEPLDLPVANVMVVVKWTSIY